ncbi:hypothetical protein A33Q_0975 [Indibacter alkaliphilus LW1]|jgi:ABC-type nitrate/sulfonate/bicarbonate transport system substrate-binding protein|uniref:Ca3427-like PBP 2 domain-containing protein n=1 Tax=Indibacter alkaliphilus (strain CCUG 57479 / KCTC 22604 / LW1) TaxID=1189612 RepID=S2E1I3_INDAL|nr:substrate-binding domain-containing protein [Indibacter alkaliphilus]EOZ98321.1 hypothetical protein A33Q_0975 [Indibacter alkaliphilus LW1]
MDKITITGVPEHFNFPWVEIIKSQPFLDKELELQWQDESKGSGAMNKALREETTDLAIVLTESFVKDKIEGNPSRIVGLHVASPLNWGIHVSGKSKINQLEELKNAPFLISRFGSGSHLMAFLLAKREGWDTQNLSFEVIGNLDGAKKSFQSSIPKIFLWEKFTTKPLVDLGLFKRIGEVPTPWPCFVIAARPEVLENHPEEIKTLIEMVYQKSSKVKADPNSIPLISDKYGVSQEDISAWIQQTEWQNSSEINRSMLVETMSILKELGLIEKTLSADYFIDQRFVNLI